MKILIKESQLKVIINEEIISGKAPKVLMTTLNLGTGKRVTLQEYSDKVINQLVSRFMQEDPTLSDELIKKYIERFEQIKNSPNISEKDILKYSWDKLEQTIIDNQPKRIKAGKINDGEPKDADLVYNKKGLRIYASKTKEACIKYGNGYSFCISARGGNNMYSKYRIMDKGTPYFIFDDTKTSNIDENGEFKDKKHVLVLFVYIDEPKRLYYTVTEADNQGDKSYSSFTTLKTDYPKLKGLEKIFQPINVSSKEKAELEISTKYNSKLKNINNEYSDKFPELWGYYVFNDATKINNTKINNEQYKITAKIKPGVGDPSYYNSISSNVFVEKENKDATINKQIKNLIKIVKDYHYSNTSKTLKDIANEWDVTVEKQILPDIYKEYLEDVKRISKEYNKEMTRLNIMNRMTF
jgi:hypothetical protein